MAARLVVVTGASPGLGKSTLARGLAAALNAPLFAEEEIKTDPAFAALWTEFETTRRVSQGTLLDAAESYVDVLDASGIDIVVLDALFGYLPSLLAWGHDDAAIAAFLVRLAERLGRREIVEVHLVGDTAAALDRAATREGAAWLAEMTEKLAGYDHAPPVRNRQEAVEFLDTMAFRSRHILASAPWPVVFVDAGPGAARVLETALATIA